MGPVALLRQPRLFLDLAAPHPRLAFEKRPLGQPIWHPPCLSGIMGYLPKYHRPLFRAITEASGAYFYGPFPRFLIGTEFTKGWADTESILRGDA